MAPRPTTATRHVILRLLTSALLLTSTASSGGVNEQSTAPPAAPPTAKRPTPPPLPTLPADLVWSDQQKKELDPAIQGYDKDQVSAYFTFWEILAALEKSDGPGQSGRKKAQKQASSPEDLQRQQRWLREATDLLRPHVRTLLEIDYQTSLAADDLRGAVVALEVLSEVDEKREIQQMAQSLGERWPQLGPLARQTLDGKAKHGDVWRISDVSGNRLPYFSETMGLDQTTLSPPQGQEIVRVTARIANISKEADAPYVRWSLPSLLRMSLDDTVPTTNSPRRLASAKFLWLKSPEGMFPCAFIPANIDVFRSGLRAGMKFEAMAFLVGQLAKKALQPPPGSFVEAGSPEFALDALFTVPKGATDLKLFFLGSKPVPVYLKAVETPPANP